MNKSLSTLFVIILIGFSCLKGQEKPILFSEYWAYEILNLPKLPKPSIKKPILVAVVDDGFRLTHKELKDFIYQSPHERPSNNIDDDANGYTDDWRGWDASDMDNDPSIPEGKEREFYHGTFIAGAICKVAKMIYGEDASDYIKIVPVKVLSDYAQNTFLVDGYKGVEYAMKAGVDVICCAWSGGTPDAKERAVFQEAQKKGIAIICAAGNTFSEGDQFPGALNNCMAIGAVDGNIRKCAESSYGRFVDLAAPGRSVKSAHPDADNAYFSEGSTSAASALVAGLYSALRLTSSDNDLIWEALVNTARPLEGLEDKYKGKLGAGLPDFAAARQYLINLEYRNQAVKKHSTEGYLIKELKAKSAGWKLDINPDFEQVRFYLEGLITGELSVWVQDTLWASFEEGKIPLAFNAPAGDLTIRLSRASKKERVRIFFEAEFPDKSGIYCSGIRHLNVARTTIEDGSGDNQYANGSDCKWIISAEEGHRIHFRFEEMDTQAKVDYVWLFDGDQTIPENAIAKFSGSQIPPEVTSRTNKVLVWFVTDDKVTGQGWKLEMSDVAPVRE